MDGRHGLNRLEAADEKINDALSLIILMENDFSTQRMDDVYVRTLGIIHGLVRDVQSEISHALKEE